MHLLIVVRTTDVEKETTNSGKLFLKNILGLRHCSHHSIDLRQIFSKKIRGLEDDAFFKHDLRILRNFFQFFFQITIG